MAIAQGSRHQMAYVEETVYGVTPATPVFKPLRHTGTSLALTKETLQSNEVRADRQIACFQHGNKQTGGDLSVEFSYGTFDDFLEACLGGTWATDTPIAGTDQLLAGVERRSFTIERFFSDITQYHRFRGSEINSLSLTVEPNAQVTGSFTVVGKGLTTDTAQIAGATYPAPTTTCPFNSFSGTINEGGAPVSVITSLQLSVENGLEPQFVVGSDEVLESSIGRSNVTGTVAAFFEDSTLLDKFINETGSSIDLTLVDADGNQYMINLPNIKYSGGNTDVSGDGPITIDLPFQALFDPVSGSNIVIERTTV